MSPPRQPGRPAQTSQGRKHREGRPAGEASPATLNHQQHALLLPNPAAASEAARKLPRVAACRHEQTGLICSSAQATCEAHQGKRAAAASRACPARVANTVWPGGSEARLPSITTSMLLPMKAKLTELAAQLISCATGEARQQARQQAGGWGTGQAASLRTCAVRGVRECAAAAAAAVLHLRWAPARVAGRSLGSPHLRQLH